MGMMNFIASLMMVLGRVLIAIGCGVGSYFVLTTAPVYQTGGAQELHSVVLPVLVTVLCAYFVASAFLDVYDMAIDTILMCFCLDKQHNDGSADAP